MASQHAKQSPLGKAARAATTVDGKVYFSYSDIANSVSAAVPAVKVKERQEDKSSRGVACFPGTRASLSVSYTNRRFSQGDQKKAIAPASVVPANFAQEPLPVSRTNIPRHTLHSLSSPRVVCVRSVCKAFNPDIMVAIGGGGFIPARMLRTEVRVPILAVSLELYDDVRRKAEGAAGV